MRLMLIVLGLCISGCASLSKGGGAVRQFSGNPLPECSYLGNVMGSGLSGVGGAAYEPAQRDLRNKTAELGGNFVRISSFGGALVKDVEGEARGLSDKNEPPGEYNLQSVRKSGSMH
jgi:hypothetical protein